MYNIKIKEVKVSAEEKQEKIEVLEMKVLQTHDKYRKYGML